MNSFLEYLIKNIVDKPEAVSVTSDGENLSLRVDPQDMGRVIGKQGRIIRAIRDLVHVLGIKENRRANVILTE